MTDDLRPTARLPAIDALRGVAIFGILLMNVASFAMPYAAYNDPRAFGDDTGLNALIFRAGHVFFSGKFLSLLSLLFGAGIVLRGLPSMWPHGRRMVALGVIGLLHAYLLWYGDILFAYAVAGLIVFWFRSLSGGELLTLGGIALLIGIGFSSATTLEFLHVDPATRAMLFRTPPAMIADELTAYRSGYLVQFADRVPRALAAQTEQLLLYTLPNVAGLMLIGMGLAKFGFVQGRWSMQAYAVTAVIGCTVGWSLTLLAGLLADRSPDNAYLRLCVFNLADPILGAITAIGYAALILPLAMRWSPWPLVAVGRTALSCYLLQTLICTTLFYGHGLGWFGTVDRAGQLLIVGGVWAVLLVIAPLWLRWFRLGPVEWLWRRVG